MERNTWSFIPESQKKLTYTYQMVTRHPTQRAVCGEVAAMYKSVIPSSEGINEISVEDIKTEQRKHMLPEKAV